jgi:hypothetical protein
MSIKTNLTSVFWLVFFWCVIGFISVTLHLNIGLFLGSIGALFWIFVFATAFRSSSKSESSKKPYSYYHYPQHEPEKKVIPTFVPILQERPKEGAHCFDCYSGLNNSENAFFYVEHEEKEFLCSACRDKRIARKRSLAKEPSDESPISA